MRIVDPNQQHFRALDIGCWVRSGLDWIVMQLLRVTADYSVKCPLLLMPGTERYVLISSAPAYFLGTCVSTCHLLTSHISSAPAISTTPTYLCSFLLISLIPLSPAYLPCLLSTCYLLATCLFPQHPLISLAPAYLYSTCFFPSTPRHLPISSTPANLLGTCLST